MPEKKPSGSDWWDKVLWALFIRWIVLGLSQCESSTYYPGNDCWSPRPGVDFGSDC